MLKLSSWPSNAAACYCPLHINDTVCGSTATFIYAWSLEVAQSSCTIKLRTQPNREPDGHIFVGMYFSLQGTHPCTGRAEFASAKGHISTVNALLQTLRYLSKVLLWHLTSAQISKLLWSFPIKLPCRLEGSNGIVACSNSRSVKAIIIMVYTPET